MRLLYYKNYNIYRRGVERAFERLGYDVTAVQADRTDGREWDESTVLERELEKQLDAREYDAAFSVNFNPQVARACEKRGLCYISWMNDSPMYIRDEEDVKRSCNRIYTFDRGYIREYEDRGYPIRYMPLAVDTEMFAENITPEQREIYETDVSMVGSLYFTNYEQVVRPLTQETKALLEQMMDMQQKVKGESIFPKLLTEGFISELNRQYQAAGADFTVDAAGLEYLMLTELTGRERRLIMTLLGKHHEARVYSKDDFQLPHVDMRPPVDYWKEMPGIFRYSRININATLRAIRTGIPLRVLDVLACGGFLITNAQEEICEYFVPDEELVVYRSIEELYDKAEWYLSHDVERKRVAEAGFRKVKSDFTFDAAIRRMLEESCGKA